MLSVIKWPSGGSRNAIYVFCFFLLLLDLAASFRVEAQSVTSPLVASSRQTRTLADNDVTIAPGDRLTITVFDTPEFSGPVRVSNDGNIDIPLIGTVHVVGLSTTAAANLIREQLISQNFLKDPQVSINFEDFNHSAILLGEVIRPGPVLLNGIRTLWDVIGAAGGVTSDAGSKVTIIHEGKKSSTSVFNLNWNQDLIGQPNPVIYPGDTVQVSRAGVVYVVGEVNQQGGYPITHQRLTVSGVVALAHGIKYTSKASHARLIRTTPSTRIVREIDIPKIIKGEIPDVALQDDDILYVPNSASKVAILRGLQAAVGISSSLIIYRNQ